MYGHICCTRLEVSHPYRCALILIVANLWTLCSHPIGYPREKADRLTLWRPLAGRGNDGAAPSAVATSQPLFWRCTHLSVLPPACALLQSAILGPRGLLVVLVANLGRPAAAHFHDHRVQGRTVFPAAGYLELAVSGTDMLTGDRHLTLIPDSK